ncbi:MAG: HlyD family efflux transporter periplasmic adaptor subunit [Magnetococcales bacterium]|nr:HlyD family efflux transporter periplasmic adaptor subunit [Magnetococcales bacterium]
MTQTSDTQVRGLSLLLELETMARQAPDLGALGFLLVNETHLLTPYRQAAFWRREAPGRGAIAALSGLAEVDPQTPFVAWLNRRLAALDRDGSEPGVRLVDPETLPAEERAAWDEWLPPRAIWLPLDFPGAGRAGGLLLARENPWSAADQELLSHLSQAYAHAWFALLARQGARRWRSSWPRRPLMLLLGVLALGMLGLPVRQTVLAPAEVVAVDPVVVRAPQDGVVARFLVQPNRAVRQGQFLFALEDTSLKDRLEVARTLLDQARQELRQESQRAVLDRDSKIRLALLQGRMEQRQAELDHVEQLLARTRVESPRDGIALFDTVNDWLGRPVSLGQRILTIADPDATELELHLPVKDAVQLQPGAEVRLFLNTQPGNPLVARLTEASHQPFQTPDGFLAYRLKARFDATVAPRRIGLRGTGRIYGDRVYLFQYLLRRPLAELRQMLGF